MKSHKKIIFSFILVPLIFILFHNHVHAEDITFTVDQTLSTGESSLTLSGSGAIDDYNPIVDCPGSRIPAWRDTQTNFLASYAYYLNIQNGITRVGNYAFYKMTNLMEVQLPSSLISIGEYAFAINPNLRIIEIPSSVVYIAPTAFDSSRLVTIYCKENSYAHNYAMKHNINYLLTDKLNISLEYKKTTYTGTIQKPAVTVRNAKNIVLKENTDYTITYSSNCKNVGKYKITVQGIGRYSGKKAAYFTIVPKAPSNAKAALYGYNDVKFTWKAVKNADGYYVSYKKGNGSYSTPVRTTNTYIKFKNLKDGSKYTFKVVSYFSYESSSSTTRYKGLKASTSSIYTLKKLNTPKLSTSNKQVKVCWNNISGETGYQISRATSKSGIHIIKTIPTTKGTYSVVSAAKGTRYYYKVRAYKILSNGTQINGPWSDYTSYKRN